MSGVSSEHILSVLREEIKAYQPNNEPRREGSVLSCGDRFCKYDPLGFDPGVQCSFFKIDLIDFIIIGKLTGEPGILRNRQGAHRRTPRTHARLQRQAEA